MNSTPCPGEETLLALLAGDGPDADLQVHVNQCARCGSRLRRLGSEVAELRGLAGNLPERGPSLHTDATVAISTSHVPTERDAATGEQKAADLTSQRLGRFQIVNPLGRGAFGTVYLAYDPHLDRMLALKVPRSGVLVDDTEVDRFLREARSAAQLRHPHIIPVYEFGKVDETSFIAYEFVEGQTLGGLLRGEGKLVPRRAADLISKLASALHYAHQCGIVHRDMKPDNVIVDARDEPHIADFGLARRSDGEVVHTREGTLLGTPSYMSPEQASGHGHAADARSDVWSLGVMLQELLTGTLPFTGSFVEVLDAVRKAEPTSLLHRDRSLPKDLQTICQKCLVKDPEQRYQSGEDLAEELNRWLRDEPILARPIGPLARAWRWARRDPTVALLTAAIFVTLLIGLSVSSYFAYDAHRQQRFLALQQAHSLRTAEPESVPLILENLERQRHVVLPQLEHDAADTGLSDKQRTRARIGLVALGPAPADDGLLQQLVADLVAAEPPELIVLREQLKPYAASLRDEFWALSQGETHGWETRFRAACALAAFDGQNEQWERIAGDVSAWLLAEDSLVVPTWVQALRPVRQRLLPHLDSAFRTSEHADERVLAASVLGDLFHDRPELLVDLTRHAEPPQLRALLPKLRQNDNRAAMLLDTALLESPSATSASERREAVRAQANVAVALLYLGRASSVWPLLVRSADNSVRSEIIHRVGPAGVDPKVLLDRLPVEDDAGVRAALVLGLGGYGSDTLFQSWRTAILPELLDLHSEHPDPGVHSAVDWLLRQWQFVEELRQSKAALVSRQPLGPRRWYLNGQGHTLVVFPQPIEFQMGMPETAEGWTNRDKQHLRRIPRGFAVAAREVTVEQFLRFAADHPVDQQRSPTGDCPVNNITWYDAVRYCRWLSEQEGVPDDQMCFPPVDRLGPDSPLPKVDLARTGYRLPTAAEWEFACRAGSETSYHFGRESGLLRNYAWYDRNSEERSWPVGLLKPNGFGLFDMHGNALEWCLDFYFDDYPTDDSGVVVDGTDSRDGFDFELRGGVYHMRASIARSAWRDHQVPAYRSYEFGFRVARSVITTSETGAVD